MNYCNSIKDEKLKNILTDIKRLNMEGKIIYTIEEVLEGLLIIKE